jgi:hypothetical protein
MVLPGAVSGISVSQSLSANQINYEDSAAFEIVLKWTGSQSAFLFNKPLRPLMAKLKVRGYSSSIESAGAGADEITTKTYRFTLIPSSAGLGTIEPITIEYLAWPDSIPGLLMTEQMSLTIARPRPAPKVDDGRATVWLWIIVPTVVALGAAAWWWSRRNKIAPVVVQSPVDIFLKKLGETRTAAGTDLKVFQTGVHRLLAEFVKARCDFYAEGKSSDEIRSALVASGVTERTAERITGWYLRAEEDKFRPVEAGPGETIRLEAEIRSCFEEI